MPIPTTGIKQHKNVYTVSSIFFKLNSQQLRKIYILRLTSNCKAFQWSPRFCTWQNLYFESYSLHFLIALSKKLSVCSRAVPFTGDSHPGLHTTSTTHGTRRHVGMGRTQN